MQTESEDHAVFDNAPGYLVEPPRPQDRKHPKYQSKLGIYVKRLLPNTSGQDWFNLPARNNDFIYGPYDPVQF